MKQWWFSLAVLACWGVKNSSCAPGELLQLSFSKNCKKVVDATDCLTVHYGLLEGPPQNFSIDPKLWKMLTQNNESANFKFNRMIHHGGFLKTYYHSSGSVETILQYSREGAYPELNGNLTHESGREFRIENCGRGCHALVNMTHGERYKSSSILIARSCPGDHVL